MHATTYAVRMICNIAIEAYAALHSRFSGCSRPCHATSPLEQAYQVRVPGAHVCQQLPPARCCTCDLGKVPGLLTVQVLQSHRLMTYCGAASGGPLLQTALWSHPKDKVCHSAALPALSACFLLQLA